MVIDNSGKAVRQDSTDVDGDGDLQEADIVVMDPIDGVPDQGLQGIITQFVADFLYPSVRVVTARELHLILAEADIAAGGDGEDELNYVRALKSGGFEHTPYNAANPLHPEPIDLLRHERRANLFNMPTLRLWDMYRFGELSPRWGGVSDAATTPGQVFVIGQNERVSNCYILGTC